MTSYASTYNTLPPDAVVPKGRKTSRWQTKLGAAPKDGTWTHIDTLGKTVAYQIALRVNSARGKGTPSWVLASIVDGDTSLLYASWQS